MIPSPTAAGDFTRRFDEADVIELQEGFNAVRPQLWTGRGPDGKPRIRPAWIAASARASLVQARHGVEGWRGAVRDPEAFMSSAARHAVDKLADLIEAPDSISGLSLLAAAVERLPVEIEANDRPDPLLPGLILSRTWEGRKGRAEALFALQQRSAAAKGFLPDMAPGEVDGEAPSATSLPLELWDLAEGSRWPAQPHQGRG